MRLTAKKFVRILCFGLVCIICIGFFFKQKEEVLINPLNVSEVPNVSSYFTFADPYKINRSCKIPQIFPYEPSSIKLINEQTNKRNLRVPECETNQMLRPKFRSDGEFLNAKPVVPDDWLNTGLCCYKSFKTNGYPDFKLEFSGICVPILVRKLKIPEHIENIQVLCQHSKSEEILYRDYFHFFRLNTTLEGILQNQEDQQKKNKQDALSFIFLGIDSLSFTNFQRFLPKTRDYLIRNLSAIEFAALNKVGRGTMENLMPTLSGCSFKRDHTVFLNDLDDCHPVWEQYSTKGYRTILSEEMFWHAIYKYMKRTENGTHNMQYDNYSFIRGIQSTCTYALKTYGCFEHILGARMLGERVLQVAKKLKGKPYYHHLWSVFTTHEDLAMSKYMDNPMFDLLTNLTSAQLLEDTILILYSDHGTITSEYSRTPPGLVEARVPLLYFVFPKSFKEKYTLAFKQIEMNSHGLTSPYDLHETLQDLAHLSRITNEEILKRSKNISQLIGVGKSLFLEMPLNRSCADAGIPEEYCICLSWKQLNVASDLGIVKGVSHALDVINEEVAKYSKCTKLDLEKIIDGKMTNSNEVMEVKFQTIPGGGIFSAVLKVKVDGTGQYSFNVLGEIERQNLYGKQSACIGDALQNVGWIRSICYCKGKREYTH